LINNARDPIIPPASLLEILDLVKHVGGSSLRLMDKVHPAVKGGK
jgi:hypothetical protein